MKMLFNNWAGKYKRGGRKNMTHKVKRIIISVIGLLVFSVLIMTWFYPYSFISVYKSYSFTSDPVVVDEYMMDLNKFKSSYERDLDEQTPGNIYDLTIDSTQYLISLFEQDWLVSKKPVKMSIKDLDNILFAVKNARKALLRLIAKENYTQVQRQYLVDSIESLLSLEEEIINIKTGRAESRKTLKIQFSNLHVSFINNFMMYEIFYKVSQEGNKQVH